ncbi:hypothetical protein [Marinirhabdus gelatinilytica]|uniref:Uncharacterized protein n=1 Tax=Marinirhabdus gelatinilytica TaxID=1703343 RepID=A0A370Q3Q0_9FLAO|nr:hypothetical protein [Marinirhabdus gelatinilytica]RDK82994.1 hypothetical protein C8D94_10914 [Marinirhabdus gelatinilytica]
MKRLLYVAICVLMTTSITSCATSTTATQKVNTELAGYTLKDKKEQFQQKIASKKIKTVVVQP